MHDHKQMCEMIHAKQDALDEYCKGFYADVKRAQKEGSLNFKDHELISETFENIACAADEIVEMAHKVKMLEKMHEPGAAHMHGENPYKYKHHGNPGY